MSEKVSITIVYSPQEGGSNIVFENEKGTIWRSNHKQTGTYNIGMSSYSIPNPDPEDSIWVIEPKCVMDRDYNEDFLRQFNKVFTWTPKAFENTCIADKTVEANHPSVYPHDVDELKKNWIPWNERNDEIVFIANNKTSRHNSELYTLRLELAEYLALNTNFKISWYGQIPIPKSYYRGQLDSKMEVLRHSKFSICTENCYDENYSHNYFSEKMPEVFLAGCVPMYMGCFNIDQFKLPPYIDLRTYVNHKIQGDGFVNIVDYVSLVGRMENYPENHYNEYLISLEENLRDPNGLFYHTSWTRVFEKMIDTFWKE